MIKKLINMKRIFYDSVVTVMFLAHYSNITQLHLSIPNTPLQIRCYNDTANLLTKNFKYVQRILFLLLDYRGLF